MKAGYRRVLNLSGRPEIFAKLQDRELRPVVSLSAEAAFSEDGVQVHELVAAEEESLVMGETVAIEDLGLIVNRIGRSIKHDNLPAGTALPPMINENATRSLAHHKHRMYGEVLEPLAIGIPTRLVAEGHDIEDFLIGHEGDDFILKPDGGSESKGVRATCPVGRGRGFC